MIHELLVRSFPIDLIEPTKPAECVQVIEATSNDTIYTNKDKYIYIYILYMFYKIKRVIILHRIGMHS